VVSSFWLHYVHYILWKMLWILLGQSVIWTLC
jgi:hypothetical protein